MKKYFFLLLSILIFSTLTGCSATKADYTPKVDTISIETKSTDLNDISKLVAEKYLSEYKKSNVVKELRLKDYEIISVRPVEGTTTSFLFELYYSTKPAVKDSYWQAGNGELLGSWIKRQSTFIKVEKSDSKYEIVSVGSGL